MIFPTLLFIADTLLWWLVPEIQQRFGVPVFTDVFFFIALMVFIWAILELHELVESIKPITESTELLESDEL